jgi:transaldolase
MTLFILTLLFNSLNLQIEKDTQTDLWIQQVVRDMINMNDLGKYSDKAIPSDVTVNLLMVEALKNIKYDDSQITLLVDHGTGKYCTELQFNYLKKNGKYYLGFGTTTSLKVFGKEKKFIDPWVKKSNLCE